MFTNTTSSTSICLQIHVVLQFVLEVTFVNILYIYIYMCVCVCVCVCVISHCLSLKVGTFYSNTNVTLIPHGGPTELFLVPARAP